MKNFTPERVFIDPEAKNYPLTKKIEEYCKIQGIPTAELKIQSVMKNIPGENQQEKYARAKKTLMVRTKKSLKFDVCKPSADYEFPLVTNCPGHCEYCYLQTTQAYKPYLTAYVNLEEIFEAIVKHIDMNEGKITTFEVASTGDPLALEHITGSIAKTIEFFGTLQNGRLRLVTKFDNVDSLLSLNHNEHTKFRVSVNSRYVIDNFEHSTASFEERLKAASKIASAGYPIGFIVAPIMLFEGWREQYTELFENLSRELNSNEPTQNVTFELIQHRFTPIAKKVILERFPNTKLEMDENNRRMKWGKFGKYKYVYNKEDEKEIRNFITGQINKNFPTSSIDYFT